MLIIRFLFTILSTIPLISALISKDFAACRDKHFFMSTPPTRRQNCTDSSCSDLCVGTDATNTFFYATRQNLNLRAPEFSAHFLSYEDSWIALNNDFPRPNWAYNPNLPSSQQYPLTNALYSGTQGAYDKGHLVPKESLDYSQAASEILIEEELFCLCC